MDQLTTASKQKKKLDLTQLCIGLGAIGFGLLQSYFIYANRHLDELQLKQGTRLTRELYEDTYSLLHNLVFGVMPWIAGTYFFMGFAILYCLRKRSRLERSEDTSQKEEP